VVDRPYKSKDRQRIDLCLDHIKALQDALKQAIALIDAQTKAIEALHTQNLELAEYEYMYKSLADE